MALASDPAIARLGALRIVERLRDAGHVAYFAGGCVRDELLGLRPTDYDVATDATPDRIRTLFVRTAEVGASFGVVLVKPGPEIGATKGPTIEVATFRADGPYSDRRRPDSVTFSDAQTDALRRDFTINALFLDPTVSGEDGGTRGRVIDFVGGRADLGAKVVRAVGEARARLAEDHLRALRAVRFAARLGFEIEGGTAQAIRDDARELRGVSRERIGEEIRRMVGHPACARAVSLLEDLGLDAPVLDEPHVRGTGAVLEGAAGRTGMVTTRLAAWAIDRGLDPVRGDGRAAAARLRRALSLSNDETDAVRLTLESLAVLCARFASLGVAGQKRAAATVDGGPFREAMAIYGAIDPAGAGRVGARVEELRATPAGLRPEPFVTGDDLVALGWTPGPRFKAVLDAVYDAQLEGRVSSKAGAIELARREGV